MSDISVSERRLSAALDRIDQFLDRGGVVHAVPEIEALRAARAAEAAQLGALMAEVERLLAEDGPAPVATPEVAGDAGGVPETIQNSDIPQEDR